MGTSGRVGVRVHCSKRVSLPVHLMSKPSITFSGCNVVGAYRTCRQKIRPLCATKILGWNSPSKKPSIYTGGSMGDIHPHFSNSIFRKMFFGQAFHTNGLSVVSQVPGNYIWLSSIEKILRSPEPSPSPPLRLRRFTPIGYYAFFFGKSWLCP